jgi:serine/threonine protein kinase
VAKEAVNEFSDASSSQRNDFSCSFAAALAKSGLVPQETLDRTISTLHLPQDSVAWRAKQPILLTKPSVTTERVQALARLRYPKRYTLTNETAVASVPESLPLTLSPADKQLADILESFGFLNRWQIGQLLEGRTKFLLNEYHICDAIGRGGYGHLFLAQDPNVFQFVAIKVLPLSKSTPELSQRFQNEIEMQRELQHPNLIRFIDAGEDGNVLYVVHEFVDGGDLRQLMQTDKQLPINVVCPIIAQTARALSYLHSVGIVHRDIKPANILLASPGTVKVIDFGLSVQNGTQRQSGNILSGRVAGTVDYMAPEQLRNPNEPLPAWDIYSLGILMYEMLTGTVPFPDGDSKEKFQMKLETEPRDVRIFNQNVPFDVADLLRSMITNQPNKRMPAANVVANRLDVWTPAGGLKSQLIFGHI